MGDPRLVAGPKQVRVPVRVRPAAVVRVRPVRVQGVGRERVPELEDIAEALAAKVIPGLSPAGAPPPTLLLPPPGRGSFPLSFVVDTSAASTWPDPSPRLEPRPFSPDWNSFITWSSTARTSCTTRSSASPRPPARSKCTYVKTVNTVSTSAARSGRVRALLRLWDPPTPTPRWWPCLRLPPRFGRIAPRPCGPQVPESRPQATQPKHWLSQKYPWC